MALSQTSVMKLYNSVVDDVIAGVRDCFLDDGVDEQVLQELQQLWRSKLEATGAMNPPPEQPEHQPPPIVQTFQRTNGSTTTPSGAVKRPHPDTNQQNNTTTPAPAALGSSNTATNVVMNLEPNNRVPVQLTLPAQPGVAGSQPRVFTIQIPASALQGNQLHQVLTGPLISATMSLPQQLAASLLQQHINAALTGQSSNLEAGPNKTWRSTDGADDSSDDDVVSGGGSNNGSDVPVDDEFDDDDDNDPIKDEDEEENLDNDADGPEEEPLNSEDDVSDEEPGDMFDTDNVVVCQYDKITRSRNRWKFYLKDGIMNLSGKDYVFQKANGDAEW